uniref:Major facilitator superfamily (MFS) profile domain-containing protein n=1 Tax=uncultured marine bacterium MedDCM-OCT-S01-C266 TaxID=743047 RepID=D6PCE8_9BACT|nr:hypothetical protein [uncultured marine bacterium MedDCM-OCT-S01-C266]
MKKINGIIRAWCTYDLANSVYNLVINTAIFPIYYTAITSVNNEDKVDFFGFEIVNSVLYSYTISLSYLISALLLPILSGIADYTGNKKKYLKIFTYLGAFACIGLFFLLVKMSLSGVSSVSCWLPLDTVLDWFFMMLIFPK